MGYTALKLKLEEGQELGLGIGMSLKTKLQEKQAQHKINQTDGLWEITPDLVTGVWTGCEDRSVHFRDIQNGQGANTALPVFAEYMKGIYNDTLNLDPIRKIFDISKSIDISIDCDEDLIKFKDNFDEEF